MVYLEHKNVKNAKTQKNTAQMSFSLQNCEKPDMEIFAVYAIAFEPIDI